MSNLYQIKFELSSKRIEKIRIGNKGKIILEEVKEKISEALSGEKNPNYKKGEKFTGEKNPNSKLTWEKVNYIREQYKLYKESKRKLGKSVIQLVKDLKISNQHIYDIINNKKWRNK